MKFRYTRYRQGHVLVCTMTKKEALNRRELDALRLPPEGIMPAISFHEEKLTVIYDASRCIPLSQYFRKNILSEEEPLVLVRQFLKIMSNLEENRLTVQKLVADIDNAFYNINGRMLELVFCPVQNNYSPLESRNIFAFMMSIVSSAQVSANTGKIRAFTDFIRKQQSFSAETTSAFLDDLIGNTSNFRQENNPPPLYGESNFLSSAKETAELPLPDTAAVTLPNDTGSFSMRSGAVPVRSGAAPTLTKRDDAFTASYNSPGRLQPLRNFSETSIRVESDTLSGSMAETYPEYVPPRRTAPPTSAAFLRNEATGAEFPVPRRSCTIGRVGRDSSGNTVYPDVPVTRNMRVGKHHAMIFFDGSAYYITDLGSRNGTWVNGKALPCGYDAAARRFTGVSTRLDNGAIVQLAGERFIFITRP